MKILYTTDLHGSDMYYSIIRKKALQHNVDMVINGGDMLPKRGNNIFRAQQKFIRYLEKDYFPRFEKAEIHYVCCLGNDDMRIYDQVFDNACSRFEFVHNIAQRKIEINGLEFIGMNYVADYPFGLKDRCRMDKKEFVFPIQRGTPSFSVEKGSGAGWEDIEDWFTLANTLPTIEDELRALVRPKNMRKAIYVIHMPPAGLGLDVCANGDRPESRAVFNFLLKEQPLLSLHGHIHESYKMTGIWNVPMGETICVQPGQGGMHPVYVLIDTDTMEMERFGHDTETLMVKGYTLDDGIKHIRISELPEYLIKPFKDWMQERTIKDYPGEEHTNYSLFSEFEDFCRSKGIKAKLLNTKP